MDAPRRYRVIKKEMTSSCSPWKIKWRGLACDGFGEFCYEGVEGERRAAKLVGKRRVGGCSAG